MSTQERFGYLTAVIATTQGQESMHKSTGDAASSLTVKLSNQMRLVCFILQRLLPIERLKWKMEFSLLQYVQYISKHSKHRCSNVDGKSSYKKLSIINVQ